MGALLRRNFRDEMIRDFSPMRHFASRFSC
jgi:hypothetical protein